MKRILKLDVANALALTHIPAYRDPELWPLIDTLFLI